MNILAFGAHPDDIEFTTAGTLIKYARAGLHFDPEVYVDISDTIDEKLKSLSAHKSQFAWMSMFLTASRTKHAKLLGEFRGQAIGKKYVEGFRAFRIHGYMPDFKLLP